RARAPGEARLRRRQPQPRSRRRLLDRSAADRQVVVSAVREARRARDDGDDPRHLVLQPGVPLHRRALHQRRHHRLHAAPAGQPLQGFPDAEVRHPARRRRGAVPLGEIPRPGAGDEEAAAQGSPAEQRLLRYLRLPPARDRLHGEGHSGGQHPVRVGAARCREGRRPRDRAQLRRYEAIHRQASPQRLGQAENFRGQRAPRLPETGQEVEKMSASMRILDIPKRPDPKLVAEIGKMVTPHLSDSMERLYAGGPQLRPMHKSGKLAGPAYTVKTTPGDNLLVHKALDAAKPGDVIVVDAGGVLENAIIGELMMSRARQRGVAGIVIWGAIRDSAEIAAGTYPVYASGVTHRGPYKNGPGEINVPINMGGMPVNPGDIIVGDADGLVAIPQEQAERILKSAQGILAKETAAMKEIE